MRDDCEPSPGCVALGVLMLLLLFAILVSVSNHQNWKVECIRHGAAHYDAVTGEFMWNKGMMPLPSEISPPR